MTWKPFLIDPGTKPSGEAYLAYNERRWGGDGWTGSLRAKGRRCGADFGNWVWWPHTLDAHRLMRFLSTQHGTAAADALKSALFDACYEEGRNISERACLVQVGAACLRALGANASAGAGASSGPADAASGGVERILGNFLASDAGRSEVLRECREASSSGVGGVPYFLVSSAAGGAAGGDSRPYGLSGAQDAETLLSVFNDVVGR